MRVVLLVLLALLAGCASPAKEATNATPTVSTTSTTQFVPGAPGFAVENFTAVPSDGRTRALHEDDNVTVHYTLRNAASSGVAASYLVSFIVGKDVRDVQTITLAPGASRAFMQPYGSVRGLDAVDAEVKAGDQDARLHAGVTAWPRVGALVDVRAALVTLDGWSANDSTNGTDVHLTIPQRAMPQGDIHQLRVRMLCTDATGRVTNVADALPEPPGPDNSSVTTLAFPGCADVRYGIEIVGFDASWTEFFQRVLFVPVGWQPTHS